MRLVWNKPDKKNYKQLLREYYELSEKKYGKSLLKDFSEKHIASGKTVNPLLLLDHNFALASFHVSDIYNESCHNFIGLYADNNVLLAHAKCFFSSKSNDTTLSFYTIVVEDKATFENLQIGKYNVLAKIYNEFIQFIINNVKIYYPKYEKISFDTEFIDDNLVTILELNGFKRDINDQFVYEIYERKQTDERRNTARQRKKQDK